MGLATNLTAIVFVVFACSYYYFSSGKNQEVACSAGADDSHWRAFEVGKTKEFQTFSRYVTMKDGVKLATDVYLPKHKQKTKTFPTIIHFTRYYRNWETRGPFAMIFGSTLNLRSTRYIERFLANNYAFVSVDVRGTGASEGTRPIDFHPTERADTRTILEWVLEQTWCDGNIGSTGISYDGMTAMALAAESKGLSKKQNEGENRSPSLTPVKAIAPLFSPDDVYDQCTFPGGILCSGFLADYGQFTSKLEHGKPGEITDLPFALSLIFKYVTVGVLPVPNEYFPGDYEREHQELQTIYKSHEVNFDMVKEMGRRGKQLDAHTKDEKYVGDISILDVSPVTFLSTLKELEVPVYNFGAYYDSGSILSAIHNFNMLGPDHSSLTLGPWSHGCRKMCSPFAKKDDVCFDMYGDLVVYFDKYLKATDLEREDPVHYYLQGFETWKSDTTWPPKNMKMKKFHFQEDHSLSSQPSATTNSNHVFAVDLSAHTDRISRWNLIKHITLQTISYPSRELQSSSLLTYTSSSFSSPFLIAGSPVVRVRLSSNSPNTNIFVYLEDVEEDGEKVHYVTEGELRSDFRGRQVPLPEEHKIASVSSNPEDREIVLDSFHGFNKDNIQPTEPGKVYEYTIQLLPVSYAFLPGHSFRISFAGADTDNFLIPENPATEWEVDFSSSFVLLPKI